MYLNKAKANIFLKVLLRLLSNKRCDWNGRQFLYNTKKQNKNSNDKVTT